MQFLQDITSYRNYTKLNPVGIFINVLTIYCVIDVVGVLHVLVDRNEERPGKLNVVFHLIGKPLHITCCFRLCNKSFLGYNPQDKYFKTYWHLLVVYLFDAVVRHGF